MLMPTSSEFISLCRSQVTLLTQALGASLSIIYLTEDLVENSSAQLVPIAAYPDRPVAIDPIHQLAPIAPEGVPEFANNRELPLRDTPSQDTTEVSELPTVGNAIAPQKQIILPLMHEEMVLGLLVTERDDRPWSAWERNQIQRVADTVSLACVLDQRARWLEETHYQQRSIQTQQHDVLDNLLHQLRSPLTALRTFGKLLVKRLQPEDKNYQVATSVVRESDRLQELLQQFDAVIDIGSVDLLPVQEDFASPNQPSTQPIPLLPAGVLTSSKLELEPCSVLEILQPLLESATAIAQERSLQIRTQLPASLPTVLGNGGALREVLSNLIDNALKYTPAGGQVHVKVTQTAAHGVHISISDTGVGIPPEDLRHLFERHYRGVQAQSGIPGTGLGLAIAKRLIEQMNGTIEGFSPLKREGWITRNSDQPLLNQGTTFVVELPAQKP